MIKEEIKKIDVLKKSWETYEELSPIDQLRYYYDAKELSGQIAELEKKIMSHAPTYKNLTIFDNLDNIK